MNLSFKQPFRIKVYANQNVSKLVNGLINSIKGQVSTKCVYVAGVFVCLDSQHPTVCPA